jgi:hypothetical protein
MHEGEVWITLAAKNKYEEAIEYKRRFDEVIQNVSTLLPVRGGGTPGSRRRPRQFQVGGPVTPHQISHATGHEADRKK